MKRWQSVLAAAAAVVCSQAVADEVRLTNGDEINGAIVSLDATSLKLQSENFGEMTIPRDKVALIALGNDGLPEPVMVAPPSAAAPAGGLGGASLDQLMGNPAVQRQLGGLLGQALGGQSVDDVQGQLQRSRRDLEELSEDIGGLEGEAIGNYLKIFDVLGGGLDAAGQIAPPPRRTPPPVSPPSTTPQPSTPPTRQPNK